MTAERLPFPRIVSEPIPDPLIGEPVLFQLAPRRHWRPGRVARALSGGLYDVVEEFEVYDSRRGVRTVHGRHYALPESRVRRAS